MNVCPEISDLFFNTDHSKAEIYDDGKFKGWDHNQLMEIATDFQSCLLGLDVDCPSPEEIVSDFHNRI